MSQFKISILLNRTKELIEGDQWFSSRHQTLELAQAESDGDTHHVFAVFEKISPIAGHYFAFYLNGAKVKRYEVRSGTRVLASGTTVDELDTLTEKARDLSMRDSGITLTDLLQRHPMVFRNGKALNPDFSPAENAA
ncbi:MAG TPA: hypothetical protein VHP58_04955 [Alphaproteobacteria bacterium]|nr:hypothetical protein [Alphaproteobacteria bacterium]